MSDSTHSGVISTPCTAHHWPSVRPKPLPLPCFSLHRFRRARSLSTSRHPKRLAVGVGTLGEHEQPRPPVVEAKAAGPYFDKLGDVSESVKFFGEFPSRPRGVFSDMSRVLPDYIGRPQHGHDAEELAPEAGGDGAGCDPRSAILLARVSSTHNVHGPHCTSVSPLDARNSGVSSTLSSSLNSNLTRREGLDIIVPPNARPVLRQHPPAELFFLHLPLAGHAGPLEPEVEATDAGEQGAESERHTEYLEIGFHCWNCTPPTEAKQHQNPILCRCDVPRVSTLNSE